jgi:8-oxo-dGTP pyrophosphatase MutT (NUDIX family)
VITFDLPAARFSYRVAGIFQQAQHALLCTIAGLDFWFMPGGRCEAGERSADTVMREMREELGLDARVERLVWVVENFFTHAGMSYHEIGLYYLMSVPLDSPFLDIAKTFYGDEHGQRLTCRWFPLGELERMPIYPVFLRTALQHIPATIQHIVSVDGKDHDEATVIVQG